MKRWKVLVAGIIVLLAALAGLGKLLLPRIYSENRATVWTYRFPKHDLSMTLPSDDWQEVKKPDSDVAFHNRKHSALAGVTVTQGDRETFQKAVKRMKDYVESKKDEQLSPATFTEGETDAGYPFAYWVVQAKGGQDDAVFLAISLVWCANKDLLARVMMEGPLTMRSQAGKSAEMDFYEAAAKTICLSAR